MISKFKLATVLFTWNGAGDRFLNHYFEPQKVDTILPQISDTNIKGVELQCPNHVNFDNIEQIKQLLNENDLLPVIINIPMASDIKYKEGSFSSLSREIRELAIKKVKDAVDISKELGVNKVSLFLGQDGFDYPLVSNYQKVWDNLIECFDEVASYAPDVKFCIEYKPCEPRTHQYLSSAAKTLLLTEEVGRDNIGLLVDIGHAWMAKENMGEIISLAERKNRLFHIHFNDNFRVADDDLGVGGIHFVEYLEVFYWLRKVDYKGWISLDVHSPRENPVEIINSSAEFLINTNKIIDRVGMGKLETIIDSNDGFKLIHMINEILFK